MSAQAPAQGGDSGLGTGLSVIAGVAILALVLWFTSADHLRMGVWKVLQVEAAVVGAIAPILPRGAQARIRTWQERMVKPRPPEWTPVELFKALNFGGGYLRLPALLLFGGLAYGLHWRGVARRYTKTHNFETLLVEQSRMHPRMLPVLWLKGREHDRDRGPYTWAKSPWAWSVSHKVIVPGEVPQATERSFDAEAAAAAFAAQVGARLTYRPDGAMDVDALAFHEQVLFAAFAARIMDRKKDSDALLDAVAAGFGPDFTRQERLERLRNRTPRYDWPANTAYRIVTDRKTDAMLDRTLADAPHSPEIHALTRTCRHVRPLLVLMMESAQAKYGILTTSDFIWLKAVDRTLHYALNDVGRRVASTEAGGVRAYLIAHKALLDEMEAERQRAAHGRYLAAVVAAEAEAAQSRSDELADDDGEAGETPAPDDAVGADTADDTPTEDDAQDTPWDALGESAPVNGDDDAQADADAGDAGAVAGEAGNDASQDEPPLENGTAQARAPDKRQHEPDGPVVVPLDAVSEAVVALKKALKESAWTPTPQPADP